MDGLITEIVDQLQEHGLKILSALVFMAIGWYFGKRRAQRRFARREFYDRLNVSLNIVEEGKLKIRTLVEKRCEDIFLNAAESHAVTEAAQKTTAENCLLPLPDKDYWYYLNAILNEISEKFAAGQLKRDLGLPVTCGEYVLCLTCETAGGVRMRKVRAMVVQKKTLLDLPETQPQLESETHSTRWQTLQFLARAYQSEPHRFLTVEICL